MTRKNLIVLGKSIDRDTTDQFLIDMVTLPELLSILKGQYSRATIYRWCNQGMPSRKIGHRRWFNKYEVIEWLQRRFK